MGLLTRQSREELATWADDPTQGEFAAFLDDVAEGDFRSACESRILAQGAVLNWIAANEGRSAAYAVALQVKAEVLVHQSLSIVDDEAVEVPRAKLRTALRMQVAGHWNERYRARVHVDHGGEVRIDAGLTVAMADLLERVVSTQPGMNPLPHRAPYEPEEPDPVPIAPPAPGADGDARSDVPLALPEPAGAVEAEFRI